MQEPWKFTAGDNGAGVTVSFSYLHAEYRGSYRSCLDVPELDESRTTIKLTNMLEEKRLLLIAAGKTATEARTAITTLSRKLHHLEETISLQSDNLYVFSCFLFLSLKTEIKCIYSCKPSFCTCVRRASG